MAVTIDATVGGASSNSYIAYEDAVTYFENRPNSSLWNDADEETRKQCLVYATKQIDTYLQPYSTLSTDTQALNFPRTDLVDCTGREYAEDEIPQGVLDAECEQAIYLLSVDNTSKPSLLNQGFKYAKLGPLAIETDDINTPDKLNTMTTDFLSCFGIIKGSMSSSGLNIVRTYRL